MQTGVAARRWTWRAAELPAGGVRSPAFPTGQGTWVQPQQAGHQAIRAVESGRCAALDATRVAGLSAGLLVWNNVVHSTEFAGHHYVAVNLGATGVLAYAAGRWRLALDDIGVDPRRVASGLRWGGLAALAVSTGLATAFTVPALRPLLDDGRIRDLDGAALAGYALVRIPLGTVVLEEVAFRGVLLGLAARRWGWWRGAAVSSAVFGLWHVRPATGMLDANVADAATPLRCLAVAGAVGSTMAAGLVFCALRRRSGSLLAPVVAHLTTNTLGALVAAASQRAR